LSGGVADRDASNASNEEAAVWTGMGCWRHSLDAGDIKQAAGAVSAAITEKPRGITVRSSFNVAVMLGVAVFYYPIVSDAGL
jgi:hypothetical protein